MKKIELIMKKANYCEPGKVTPCVLGCPLNNNIPKFIDYIKKEKYKKAYEVLSETTVLSPLCGRICPHDNQCQGACIKKRDGKSVKIGDLEKFIGDLSIKEDWRITSPEKTKYHVAVVGSGPAGLTCAAFLRRNGIGVTIYEKYDYLGGLLVHGIPDFRLPKKIVKEVTDRIIDLGIEVKYNMELGKDISLNYLKRKYDAIFLGIGANISNKMNIPGECKDGVYGANEMLENNIDLDFKNKIVVVSGGGNVAMDACRTIKRKGAKKVIVIYRRNEEDMSADDKEVLAAKKDGVKFLYLTKILKIMGNKKVERIEVIKTKNVKKNGEDKLINLKGSNYTINCDYVIRAIGSKQDEELVNSFNLELDKNGKVDIDKSGHTSNKKIFAGGDLAGVKGTVAWAARSGRNAAYEIIDYLQN